MSCHLLDESCSFGFPCFFVFLLIVILVTSHFRFEGWTLVLNASVPGHYLAFTFFDGPVYICSLYCNVVGLGRERFYLLPGHSGFNCFRFSVMLCDQRSSGVAKHLSIPRLCFVIVFNL